MPKGPPSGLGLLLPVHSEFRTARSGSNVRTAPYPDLVSDTQVVSAQISARRERVRLLAAELDQSRSAAVERTRTTDTKASFVVVAAGFLAGFTGPELVRRETWFVGILPLVLNLAAVVVSAVVLWPRRLKVPSGPDMVNTWVDADMTADTLEDHILEVKSKEVTNRNAQNELKARWLKWGFMLLIAAMASGLVLVIVGAVAGA